MTRRHVLCLVHVCVSTLCTMLATHVLGECMSEMHKVRPKLSDLLTTAVTTKLLTQRSSARLFCGGARTTVDNAGATHKYRVLFLRASFFKGSNSTYLSEQKHAQLELAGARVTREIKATYQNFAVAAAHYNCITLWVDGHTQALQIVSTAFVGICRCQCFPTLDLRVRRMFRYVWEYS